MYEHIHKSTGKNKDYEFIKYILNVNTQYTQVLMELNENGAMDAVYTYGTSRLTEDSYLGDIRNPLTLNRYSYCIGNPLFYIDPSGHEINLFAASALTGNKKAIEAKNQLISQGDKWAEGATQEYQEGFNQFMDDTYDWFGEHTVRKNDIVTGQINNNITAGVAGSFYNTADMLLEV